MAAFAHPSRPASSVSPRQSRAPAASRRLPNGACNWRDLNLGREADTCGCRQFWLNDVSIGSNNLLDQRQARVTSGAWCFCGHHACFHQLHGNASADGPENTEQGNNDAGWSFPENFALDLNPTSNPEQPCQTGQDYNKLHGSNPSGLGLFMTRSGEHIQQTHPSCLPRPSHLNHSAGNLPSTQSSPKMHSRGTSDAGNRPRQSPSTAFANHVASQRRHVPQMDVQNLPPSDSRDEAAQSATEIATPSNAGTPALRETDEAFNAVRTTLDAFNKNHLVGSSPSMAAQENVIQDLQRYDVNADSFRQNSPGRGVSTQPHQASSETTIDRLMAQITSLRSLLSATPNFGASLLSLNHRLEALETVSFSHVPVEELQEKFEYFDGRLLDVESKVEDLEKLQAAHAEERPRLRKALIDPNESFDSNASIGTSGSKTLETVANQDYQRISYSSAFAQLSRLEQRLMNLEAAAAPAPPTPWEIEVVLVPWGRDLKGIWYTDLSETSQFSRTDAQDPNAPRSATHSQKSASHDQDDQYTSPVSEWTNGSKDWLSPRACGPTRGTAGRVYERLKSRGFVRTIQLLANSAGTVESTICSAFSDLKTVVGTNSQLRYQKDGLMQRYLGLQAPFIPLRKVHKSSRLRHLTHAELITPSLWTAEFLNSSVFMQTPTIGHRRLFVTTAGGYTQNADSMNGWTWQMLRELPRTRPHAELENGSRFVAEADANEPCWAWDPRLDPPISVHSSFSSSISYHSSLDSHPLSPQPTNDNSQSSEIDEGDIEAEEGTADDRTARPRSPITPVSEFPLSRQSQHYRTASLPPAEPEMSLAASVPKRQIASFDQSSPAKNIPKRRRFSRSPDDVELMAMWNLTPRRSREPLSPGGAQNSASRPIFETRQAELIQASATKGRLTPQAYATPFSNLNTIEGDEDFVGDTDADSESEYSSDDEDEAGNVDLNDEAWEGVGDDEHVRAHGDTDNDDDDDDEDEDEDEDGDGMHDDHDEDELAT